MVYLFTHLHVRTENKAGREDFQETCPKETRKSNSTPQSAYPVSLAFNRMLLIASCITLSVFKGCTGKGLHWGRIPRNANNVLIVKCDYLETEINWHFPKYIQHWTEWSEEKCWDLRLQTTSGASISVALGELWGIKCSFYSFQWNIADPSEHENVWVWHI